MTRITAQEAGGVEVLALLDTIAWAEGTDKPGQKTADSGYDVIVGGGQFTGYADHPRKLVSLPKYNIKSSAAGRYQLLARYYDAYKKSLRLNDFSPINQDRIAIQQIRERKALPMIQAGKVEDAIRAISNIWASLPGAGYGQHEQQMHKLVDVYQDKLKAYKKPAKADFSGVTSSVDSTAQIIGKKP